MIEPNRELFATADVAKLLGLPKWRVIKFIEGEQYGIKPAANVGSGTGSRRLYDVENICEFAVALRLLETGLRSLDIGRVVQQLREQGSLRPKLEDNRNLYVAIARKPRAGMFLTMRRPQEVAFVRGAGAAVEMLKAHEGYALVLVPIGSTFRKLQEKLNELGGKTEEGE